MYTLYMAMASLLYEDKPVLIWVRSTKLKHFIEPYHTPYKFKHCYWTGLLLFVRVFLYLVFAFNISGDPKVNLTTITLVIGGIFILQLKDILSVESTRKMQLM